MKQQRLVLIGNGMAGVNVIEQILKHNKEMYHITIIGNEPHPNYNRIMLSYVLEGSKTIDDIVLNDHSWYKDNQIDLQTGTAVTHIDTEAKKVYTDNGSVFSYDKAIIATGSQPFVLPIPGVDKQGVIGFRDIQDCNQMMEAAKT